MGQRKSAYWMEQIDERIMVYIYNEGWATPSLLARSRAFSASRGRIRDRLKRLVYAMLVTPIHHDTFDLTMNGIMFLRGDLDADNLPTPKYEYVFGEYAPRRIARI